MGTEGKVNLDQKAKTVKFDKLVSDDPIVFELFDKTSKGDRQDMLASVLHIGALAMLEDRIHAFIDATERQIYPQLESFKRLFETRQVHFETSTQKGTEGEVDIVATLNTFFAERGWDDYAEGSGTQKGALARNKTGDVLCVLEFGEQNQDDKPVLGIEVKFDKSVALGNPMLEDVFKGNDQLTGDVKKSNFDTAWSQLLETRANRECPFAIIVFDRSVAHGSVLSAVPDVAYLPGVPGFIVLVDSQAGQYGNLFVAYGIARDLARYHMRQEGEIDTSVLELIVARIIQYLGSAKTVSDLVRKNTDATIKMNKEVQKEVGRLVALAEFTQGYLKKFLEDKTLSAKDMLEFYYAADAKAAWRTGNDELEALIKEWEG
jgi:hypothetical protein